MCGLTAFLALRPAPLDGKNGHVSTDNMQEALEASIEIVKHRGPDARGHWISADSQVGKCILFCHLESRHPDLSVWIKGYIRGY
jgi:asparagine synthetase B (glutamine-hydrolysing)